ncbi:carboxylesterase type B [Mycolicibacterium rhodesiae NBB3]|uniref:Carboxylic ester hydrolase n=1 Tax=Mycolicibacterium rhodesiae (strain NBB3) TaxID=710685 RepID=G8RQF7_MYCRN|nr:carboxylesterase type B [Mycolicibacterium rhodesiae NBB3]
MTEAGDATRRVDLSTGPALVIDDGVLMRARGVPYGSADRFASPTPPAPWAEPRALIRRGPVCPQLPSRLAFVTGPVTDGLQRSEDCQVLSVTAPSGADGLPVMVWFHGGAYVSGGGESPNYDPDALVTEGRVVVVTVSYRLGIFGYCTPLGVDEDNLGLRDQLLALRWVHDNIAAFGGDPQRVTLFGQSAGGDSVYSLMLSEAADGIYSRAIIQSAPLGMRDGRDAMRTAMRAAAAESLSDTDPFAADVERLHLAQTRSLIAARRFGAISGLSYAPILGVDPLPAAHEVTARIAHVARSVDLFVGSTKLDAAPFVELNQNASRLRALGPVGKVGARTAAAAMTRRVFSGPAERLARSWRADGGRASTYRLDWSPRDAPLGACHCMDLPLLLGTPGAWSSAPMLGPHPDPLDHRLAIQIRRLWTRFAHDGVPGLGAEKFRLDAVR